MPASATLFTPRALTAQPTGFDVRDLVHSDFIGQEICCTLELEGHGQFTPGLPGEAGLYKRGVGGREISGLKCFKPRK